MYMVRHLKVTRWAAWETAHEAGDFSANLTGQTGSHMTDPLREWNIAETINKNHIAQNSGVIFSGRGNCTSYSKLHKLVGQIVSMQSRVWWWEPEALGAGETEKGSSMDAVGEYPEWRQPADSNSPRSIHHFLVWIWARRNFVNMRYLKWKLDSPTPMHCDQPSFTWKFAVWHFVVVFLHCTTWGAWGTIRSHQRTWQKDYIEYNIWYSDMHYV